MLTTAPHLRTRRPSPTTVEYTVSTSPALTFPLRLLLLLTIALRVLLGCSAVLLLYARFALFAPPPPYEVTPAFFTNDFIWHTLNVLLLTAPGIISTRFATALPLAVLLPLSLLTLYLTILRLHTSESLLVLRGLGIQTSTSSPTYLGFATTRFIPTEKIQDILVNEAFRGFEVRYYLVVIVEGEEDVVVVFPGLLPRRGIVEVVWRGARGCLYEPGKEKGLGFKG